MAAFSSRFAQAAIAQDAAVLKHYWPRTPDNAICPFRKVFGPFSWAHLLGACHFLTISCLTA